jgi:hypothetical protein
VRRFLAAALLSCLTACGEDPIAKNEAAPAPANAVANLAQAPQPVAVPSGPPLVGRCWMGSCTWFRIVSRQLVRETSGERLIRAALIPGVSESADGTPETPRGAGIRWDEASGEIWFLCSARRPTVILQVEAGGWEATTLDFVGGPYGVTEAVSAKYVAACHPGDDMYRRGFAARHNYRPMMPQIDTYALASPEAIFDHHN